MDTTVVMSREEMDSYEHHAYSIARSSEPGVTSSYHQSASLIWKTLKKLFSGGGSLHAQAVSALTLFRAFPALKNTARIGMTREG